jgi:hypothetical protein
LWSVEEATPSALQFKEERLTIERRAHLAEA